MSTTLAANVQYHTASEDVEIVPGLLIEAVFGTNAGFSARHNLRHHVVGITTVPAAERRQPSMAEHIRKLRDEICRCGLTRQDVARAVGVDRRSLSGFASGEINPQPERVRALRFLAQLTRAIEGERPGQARTILLSERGDTTLLDTIAKGRYIQATAWRTWASATETKTVIEQRPADDDEPIWAAAARALAAGQLSCPPRATTVRPEAAYEVDPTEAAAFDEPPLERRRPRYR